MKTIFVIVGVLALAYLLFSQKKEGFDPAERAQVAYAVSNVGSYDGKAFIPDDYVQAIVSSRSNDEPWKEPPQYNAVNTGALQGVGYPLFTVNLPRLDDRQF